MRIKNKSVKEIYDNTGILLTDPKKLHTSEPNRSEEFDLEFLRHLIMNDEMLRFYKSTIWLKVRQDILERDKWECQLCKIRGNFTILRKHGFIHHMAELKLFPEHCLDYNNLVHLCWNCHEETHGRYQYQLKEEKVFDNFDSAESW